MEAAVKAGCDAVYAGGSFFSARAYAGNFDQETFLKAIDHCHFYGVHVYMTVNTLLMEEETARLSAYVRPYYEAGLDGGFIPWHSASPADTYRMYKGIWDYER